MKKRKCRKLTKYSKLGVDVEKKGVQFFTTAVNNLYPNAFSVITQDPESIEHGITLHTDSAGSKPVQSYLHWKETGDLKAFSGLSQDVVAMNLDDVVCVGANPVSFVDYIALNPLIIPKSDLLSVLSKGFQNCFNLLRNNGVDVKFGGGETADLPDQILTLDISGTVVGRVKLSEVISGEKIKSGDVIIGLRSGGECAYEEGLNSGIMCNGITLARHVLMSQKYSKRYPELTGYGGQVYSGNYLFNDHIEDLEMTVGEAIISPTRIYTPIIIEILRKFSDQVTGLVHNTGGGMTKCLRIGNRIHYHKFDLPQPDPIFKIIKMVSGESWETMYKNFNMGVGFEIVVKQEIADEVMDVSERYKVGAKRIGRCEKAKSSKRNTLLIESPWGTFNYT